MAPAVWYHVRDLDGARQFYRETLGFEETGVDFTARWSLLKHGLMEIGLAEGEPRDDSGVAHVDVTDLKVEADRLRAAGVDVGIVFELQGEMRLLDVYDPDGNRVQLAQELQVLRPVDVHDVRFLRDMLRHAYHWRLSEDSERPVYRYVSNWGRRGDTGVMALEGPHAYGAAWFRLFTADEPGFGFVDEATPELTIAVVPSRRGKGAGAELLQALLARAREEGYSAISLSTAKEQTEFYERYGFETVRETPHAVTMVARL